MDLLAKEVMRRNVLTVAPDVKLPELEELFLKERVSGLAVVDRGELVGIVSRSDIVRQLLQEHHLAESTSDYYCDDTGFHELPLVTFEQVADRVGERIEMLCVRDVMSDRLVKVGPDQPLRQVAEMMVDNRVHRVLVTEHDRLVGVISALDLARLIADGRLGPAE
jgi:CBS domain-containing protein